MRDGKASKRGCVILTALIFKGTQKMKNKRIRRGMENLLLWIFILLFIVLTDTLVYASSLLNFKEGSQLILVFSLYLLAYIAGLSLLAVAWNWSGRFTAPTPLPGQRISVNYEATVEEHEQIRKFLTEIRKAEVAALPTGQPAPLE
jgi:hypothetical protein